MFPPNMVAVAMVATSRRKSDFTFFWMDLFFSKKKKKEFLKKKMTKKIVKGGVATFNRQTPVQRRSPSKQAREKNNDGGWAFDVASL